MPKKRTAPPPQPTLFDLEQFTTINCACDEAWDEDENSDRDLKESAPEQQQPLPLLEAINNAPPAIRWYWDEVEFDEDTTEVVLEQVVLEQDNKVAPEQKNTHWIEEYPVTRNEQKYWYYRYCWMEGRKIHHIHIPGGNVKSRAARETKAAVESAIAFGESPSEIEKLIRQKSKVRS